MKRSQFLANVRQNIQTAHLPDSLTDVPPREISTNNQPNDLVE